MKFFLYINLLFLFSNILIYCSQNSCYEYSCEECESDDYRKCIKCKDTFLLVDRTCPCEDFGCALCTSGLVGSKCLLCKNGFVLENNDCKCKRNNCEICGENKCIKCIRGYYYNDTLKECVKNDCFIPNCEYCSSENDTEEANICYRCNEGYYYDNGNCIELNSEGDEFERCPKQDLYEINMYCDAKCTGYGCNITTLSRYTKNCHSNECIFCNQNILYLYSNCETKVECNIEGCNTCLTEKECARCDRGYKIDLGLCVKCIEGCSVCSNNYTCDYCLSGYELNSEKQCIFSNDFDFDIIKYKNLKQTLMYNIDNCEIYGNPNECLECKSGYLLENNKCDYYCYDRNCVKCGLVNNVEKCFECRENYYNNSKFCYEKCLISYCKKCAEYNNYYCYECEPGKKAIDGICINEELIKYIKNDDNNNNKNDNEKKNNNKNENNNENINDTLIYYNSSNKNKSYLIYIIVGIFVLVLIIIIIYFIIRRLYKRDSIENNQNVNIQNNQIDNYANNDLNYSSGRKKITEKVLEKEFNKYKVKTTSENNECNICFKNKHLLGGFKCGCALRVCKECYIKCKSMNNKCPGCRATI